MNSKKVLFLSGRESNYPRNHIIINSLKKYFLTDVLSTQKQIVSNSSYFQILFQSFICIVKAIPKLIIDKCDALFVGFFGQFIVIPISLLSRKPIVFDLFVSAYDTIVDDRKIIKPDSLIAKVLFSLDKISCRKAKGIFVDTKANLDYFNKLFSIPKEKMRVIYVGCDENLFVSKNLQENPNLVLYYTSYMPLHGVDVILKAAKILENTTPINFKIIGDGIEFLKIQNLAKTLNLNNVSFSPSIPLSELPNEIASASICLGGPFGHTEKANRVIAGKTYQLLAMKKAIIVSNNEANNELLTHGKDAWFCEISDPLSLADAIKYLHKEKSIRKNLGLEGYKTFKKIASLSVIEKNIYSFFHEILSN